MQTGIVYTLLYFQGTSSELLYYDCGSDGSAILLTGPHKDYFYIDGVWQKAYQLVQDKEGNFYFINNGHKIAKNTKLYLSERFVAGKTLADGTPISVGTYEFDMDGKMILKHGIIDDCIYINGVLQRAYQLVEFEGNLYFVNDGKNRIAKNLKF